MLCDKAAWTLISEVEESEVRGLAPDSQVRLRSLSYYAFVFFFFVFLPVYLLDHRILNQINNATGKWLDFFMSMLCGTIYLIYIAQLLTNK